MGPAVGTSSSLQYALPEDKNSGLTSKIDKVKMAMAFAETVELPEGWYRDEFKKGNYDVKVEFERCMTQPRSTVVFKNKERELKKRQASLKRQFKSAYKKQAEVLSELRYDVMEFNKWYQDVALPEIMLSNDGKKAYDELIKSMPIAK